jgi:hypothetical protein
MRCVLALLLLVVPGLAGAIAFAALAVTDFRLLRPAYANFLQLSAAPTTLPPLLRAEAVQNLHRLNLCAEGTGALLCALVAALGIHALLTLPCASRGTSPRSLGSSPTPPRADQLP